MCAVVKHNGREISIKALLRHTKNKADDDHATAAEEINKIEKVGAIHKNIAAVWFKRFREDHIKMTDESLFTFWSTLKKTASLEMYLK